MHHFVLPASLKKAVRLLKCSFRETYLREPRSAWVAQLPQAALSSKVDHLNSSACSTVFLSLVGSGCEEKDGFRSKRIKHAVPCLMFSDPLMHLLISGKFVFHILNLSCLPLSEFLCFFPLVTRLFHIPFL